MYLARDIPPFVMYCIYGESCSSLLIESTDSMISRWPWVAKLFWYDNLLDEKLHSFAQLIVDINSNHLT